jgi:hypothetical protein
MMTQFHSIAATDQADVEAALHLIAMSKSPSPPLSVFRPEPAGLFFNPVTSPLGTITNARVPRQDDHTPNSSPRKRTSSGKATSSVSRKRLCQIDDNAPMARALQHMAAPIPPASPGQVDFFIHGSQGQLAVCERKSLLRDGNRLSYLLVRLRGQSNTLPHDARLAVSFAEPQSTPTINVHIARVRIKAGQLKYDFLPEPCTLPGAGHAFSAPMLASIFSKKCWSGVVVRGPRMFVAFIQNKGQVECHSLPMFVEISPTSNSPGYRDPVLEYPDELITQFFDRQTFAKLGRLHHSGRRELKF